MSVALGPTPLLADRYRQPIGIYVLRNPSTEGVCRLLNAGHVPFDHPRVEFIKILNALDTPMWCRKAPNAWRLTCGRVPEPGSDFVRAEGNAWPERHGRRGGSYAVFRRRYVCWPCRYRLASSGV